MACDPNFSKVALLVPCDTGNDSNDFIDLSNNAWTVNAYNAYMSNTNTLFGAAASLDLTLGIHPYIGVSYLANSPLDLVTAQADWTVEMWAYISSASTASEELFDLSCDFTTLFQVGIESLPSPVFVTTHYVSGPWTLGDLSSAANITVGAWNHIAVVRDGSNLRLFLNGVMSVGTIIAPIPALPSSPAMYFGAAPVVFNPGYFALYDIRVTNGIARYTADFTPPTAPFGLACPPPPFNAYGKFVPAPVFEAVIIVYLPDIEPKVWRPIGNRYMRSIQ